MKATEKDINEIIKQIMFIVQKTNSKHNSNHLRFFVNDLNSKNEFKKQVKKIVGTEDYILGSLEEKKGFLSITINGDFEEISYAFRSVFFYLRFDFFKNEDSKIKFSFSIEKQLDKDKEAYEDYIKDLVRIGDFEKITSFSDSLGEHTVNAWKKVNQFLSKIEYLESKYSVENFEEIFEKITMKYQSFWHVCYGESTNHIKENFRFEID